MKEALLYIKESNQKVKCQLCPWNCVIKQDSCGVCGVRKNINGKLYSLIYEKVSSLAVDPIEKKPLYHFYPKSKVLSLGTFGCNMKCGHCQNWNISQQINLEQAESISTDKLIEIARRSNCQGIAWTYNEPTIWFEYTLEGAKIFKNNKLYTIYVTNGYISFEALDMIGPYLDAFRVDIKAFDNQTYKKLCKIKDFEPILEATKRAKHKWNMHVEVITNIIPTLNDDARQLELIAKWIKQELGENTPWHVTRFHPYQDYKHLPPTPIETLEMAREIGIKQGLQFVYIGNVHGNQHEDTICPKCHKIAIERKGYLITINGIEHGKCMHCGQDLNIRE